MQGETVAFLRILNKEIRLYPYMKSDLNVFMAELLNIKPPDMVLETELNPYEQCDFFRAITRS